MEFCPHCRGMRRARKTTRTRREERDGQEVDVRTHHYACAQCGSSLYTNEQVTPVVAAESADEPATPEAAPESEPDAEAAPAN